MSKHSTRFWANILIVVSLLLTLIPGPQPSYASAAEQVSIAPAVDSLAPLEGVELPVSQGPELGISTARAASRALLMGAQAGPTKRTAARISSPYDDEFDGPELNSRWYWLNEDPTRWSLATSPGYLRIVGTDGDMLRKCNNPTNLLLQSAPTGDFQIETTVTIQPIANYQQAGLIVFDDMKQYIKLDVLWNDTSQGGQSVEFIYEQNDSPGSPWPWMPSILSKPAYLRVMKTGDVYDGFYSTDGNLWNLVGSIAAPDLVDPMIGIYALTSAGCIVANPPDITADFGFFRATTLPSVRLDLPFDYGGTEAGFRTAALGSNRPGGRVNSWFDHSYPTYDAPPNAGTNNITRWNGGPIEISPDISAEDYGLGKGVWWYDGHDGIDFSGTEGDSVQAAASGTIDEANTGWGCLGWHVTIDHGNGYKTIYGHLQEEPTVVGSVEAREVIGKIGNTFDANLGCSSSGAHLHFEVQLDGKPVDPYGWAPPIPDPWGGPVQSLWKYAVMDDQQVDSSGTTLSTPSGSASTIIPTGALTTTVAMELWDEPPIAMPSAQLRSTGYSFWLLVREWLSGGGLTLMQEDVSGSLSLPITLTVTYSETGRLHLDESQLSIYRWEESSGSWESLTTEVNADLNQAIAHTTEIGHFDLQAPLLCPADSSEPDDSYYAASVIEVDGTQASRLLDVEEDEDWFRLEASAGNTYEIETVSLAGGVDTVVELYAPNGQTLIASDDDSGTGLGSYLEWRAPSDDTYFVRVVAGEGGASGCEAGYELSVQEYEHIYLPLVVRND